MAIEYVEIRDENRAVIGIIDTAQSIIWHTVYKGVGDFEIYAAATVKHIDLLKIGNYVTRIDDDGIGIIEQIAVNYTAQNGRMITATGRLAKSILDRRHIYNLSGHTNTATIISGNVEEAVRLLVENNAINCSFDTARNFEELELGAVSGLSEIIVDENGVATQKQVSFENLLTYTDEVLAEYDIAAKVVLSDENKLQYVVYKGKNRSINNTEGNEAIIFSQEFDNLLESNYAYLTESAKNTALIGGEGEGIERFYSILKTEETGLKRRETFIDGSSLSKQYKDETETEQTYTDDEYDKMLKSQGKQTLSEMEIVETFSGTINVTNGQFKLNRDFFIGDKITIQDNLIGKYINPRVAETTEAQDENGYTVEINFE